MQLVTLMQNDLVVDALGIEVCPVERAGIANHVAVCGSFDFRMAARHRDVVEADLAIGMTAETGDWIVQRECVAGLGSGSNDQRRNTGIEIADADHHIVLGSRRVLQRIDLCERDGVPKYITSVCRLDTMGAWRGENRLNSGVVVDITTNEVVCEGLTMPHSPRWYKGRLWVLEAGTGYFGYVDFETKKFVRKAFIPGYLRGLDFIGNYAIIGCSDDRHEKTFSGLPLHDNLTEKKINATCGIYILNLDSDQEDTPSDTISNTSNNTYDIVHHFTFTNVKEIYDVRILKNIKTPRIFGLNDESVLQKYKI